MEDPTIDPSSELGVDDLIAREILSASQRRATLPPVAPTRIPVREDRLRQAISEESMRAQSNLNRSFIQTFDSLAAHLGEVGAELSDLREGLRLQKEAVDHAAAAGAASSDATTEALGQRLDCEVTTLRQEGESNRNELGQRISESEARLRRFVEEQTATEGERAAERALAVIRPLLRETDARAEAAAANGARVNQRNEETIASIRAELDARTTAADEARNKAEQLAATLNVLEARVEERITAAAAEITRRLQADAEARDSARASESAALAARIDELERRIAAIALTADQSRAADAQTAHELEALQMRLLRAERRMRVRPSPHALSSSAGTSTAAPGGGPPAEPDGLLRPESLSATTPEYQSVPTPFLNRLFDYFMFEHAFRGTLRELKNRQTQYLDLFRDRGRVLDLGCGRGEFLELLSEAGVDAVGVDSNEDMVDFCTSRGLNVVRSDLFQHLEGVPDRSIDGIFASQVVEHLSPDLIARLIDLCAAKLRPGGLFVAETINANCLHAMKWFYLDPTHVRPVPAELLRFMLKQGGFHVEFLRFSAPLALKTPDGKPRELPRGVDVPGPLPEEIQDYQDYAAVATQPDVGGRADRARGHRVVSLAGNVAVSPRVDGGR